MSDRFLAALVEDRATQTHHSFVAATSKIVCSTPVSIPAPAKKWSLKSFVVRPSISSIPCRKAFNALTKKCVCPVCTMIDVHVERKPNALEHQMCKHALRPPRVDIDRCRRDPDDDNTATDLNA